MDLLHNDYHSLHQLIEKAQLDQLSSRFEKLKSERTKAKEGRRKLREACRFVKDSAEDVGSLLRQGSSSPPDIQRCQDALQRDCTSLADIMISVSNAESSLGALETSLQESLSLAKPLIMELAAKADVQIPPFLNEGSSSALQSWASDQSVEDTELPGSRWQDYYDCLSKESALKEQIDGIVIQLGELDGRRYFFAEQERSLPESLELSYVSLEKRRLQLERDYDQAKLNTRSRRAQLEEPQPKSSDNSRIPDVPQAYKPIRVQQWLQDVGPQQAGCEVDKGIKSLSTELAQLDLRSQDATNGVERKSKSVYDGEGEHLKMPADTIAASAHNLTAAIEKNHVSSNSFRQSPGTIDTYADIPSITLHKTIYAKEAEAPASSQPRPKTSAQGTVKSKDYRRRGRSFYTPGTVCE